MMMSYTRSIFTEIANQQFLQVKDASNEDVEIPKTSFGTLINASAKEDLPVQVPAIHTTPKRVLALVGSK
jgi:hypothetical protein